MTTSKLPDPSGWRFVFVHRFARHTGQHLISGYTETARSFLSLHHGVVKPTVVIKSKPLRDRILRTGGWEEITAEVGPQTPRLWDEERDRWRLDGEGYLPWERAAGARSAPVPIDAEPDKNEEELDLEPAPPQGTKAAPAEPPAPKVDPKSTGALTSPPSAAGGPGQGKVQKKPSSGPRG